MRARLLFALSAALAAVLALSACSGAPEKPAERTELRIGLIANLSGPPRFDAHELALARVAQVNAAGGVEVGGRRLPVRLMVADNAGQVEQSMAAVTRLVQQERVSAVIGPYLSREALPVAASLEALRVPMITPTASNPAVTKGRKFVFRMCQLDSDQGVVLSRVVHSTLGLRRAAVLYDESDAYSAGLAGFFRAAFAPLPGAAVTMVPYASGTQDFLPQLSRAMAAGAQLLFLPNFPGDLALQLPQARAAGFSGLFLGSDSWDSDRDFHALPEAQGALYTTNFSAEGVDPALLARAQALASRPGLSLVQNHVLTLDALELLLDTASRTGSTDPVSLRSGLAAVRGFQGLTGELSFNEDGDPARTVFLVAIEGGERRLRARLDPPASGEPR